MALGLSGKSKQQLMEWWKSINPYFSVLLRSLTHSHEQEDLIGLVINPQYMKLLKIRRAHTQYEVENFDIIDLPSGLINDLEVKDAQAVAGILRQMIADSGLEAKDVVLSIPRSAAIVKTILVDSRLHADEIESRVWLEADRLFPSLINDIYLDFSVTGPAAQDVTQLEVLIVACRKDQLNPYLEVMQLAGLNTKVVDVNYYAYERALLQVIRHSPEMKTVALLNINFRLIDLLVISEGKLVYTHELSYDGHQLLKLRDSIEEIMEVQNNTTEQSQQPASHHSAMHDILKTSVGLHLKHALQFFYSSKPNTRVDRIILGGDVPATIPHLLDYVKQETGKDVVMADPFVDMKFEANVDQARLTQYAPGLMLCCGLALTKLSLG